MAEGEVLTSCAARSSELPVFPTFLPVEQASCCTVEALTAGFEPFADFNFVELWSWNRGAGSGLSTLNGNLVTRWEDVITGEHFLTFLGTNQVLETIETLIDYALEAGIDPQLAAVPEPVVQSDDRLDRLLDVNYDPINSDYLLSTEEWTSISGARFKNKRNAIHRLERNHQPELRRIDLADPATQEDVRRICRLWADLRQRSDETTRAEFSAIDNLLDYAARFHSRRLYAIGVFIKGEMVGFSVNEELPDGYSLGHFSKADYRFEGIYSYMLRNVAQHMHSQSRQYLNIEADLGDRGLMIAKRLCHPVGMLKKYTICRKVHD